MSVMTGAERSLPPASPSSPRLGLLLVSDSESEEEEEASEVAEEDVVSAAQLIRLFNYLRQHKSAREALRWLYQVARMSRGRVWDVVLTSLPPLRPPAPAT